MSHLGFQILYHILNQTGEIACERAFAPWPDMEKFLQDRALPLTSLESSLPLRDFDLIGFSLQYELNYTGILNILHLSGIPLQAADRGEKDPLIIGGGPCATNPEPLADFFDVFVLGDGEEVALGDLPGDHRFPGKTGNPKMSCCAGSPGLKAYTSHLFSGWNMTSDGPIKQIIPLKKGYSHSAAPHPSRPRSGSFPLPPHPPFHGSHPRSPEYRSRPGLHPGVPISARRG